MTMNLAAPAAHLGLVVLEDLDAPIEFSYAFQPIVDTAAREIVSHEALIRGLRDEPALAVLARVPPKALYRFDAISRSAAIALAARLSLPCRLNVNFLPKSLLASPDALNSTLDAAVRHGLPINRLVLEVSEREAIDDLAHFARTINECRGRGLRVAIDDFGAGHSALNLLAEFQPDEIKLDMALIRGIERHGPRQSIVRAIRSVCLDLGIGVVAEGVETAEEYRWLSAQGIHLFQGYLFARPAFAELAKVCFPPVE